MDSFKTNIGGEETLFVLRRFHSKTFLVITQYGKIANIFTVRQDVDAGSQMGLITGELDIQCHFGKDTDELQAAIRRIVIDSTLANRRDPLILSLALKQIDKSTIDGISEALKTRLTNPAFIDSCHNNHSENN